MTTYGTMEQLMDDVLDNLYDAADAAATPKEREASEHGVETMEFISTPAQPTAKPPPGPKAALE